MALCRVSFAKERCHNPHHSNNKVSVPEFAIRAPTSEFFQILLSCTDPDKVAETLVNLSEASQGARTLKDSSPLQQIYSSPWSPGLRICKCVQSSAPIAHRNANLFYQSSLAP